MSQDQRIDQLNHLIAVNHDALAGLRAAAEAIKNSELETLFSRYAERHARFRTELQEEIRRLGGEPSDTGTISGAARKGWLEIKTALGGDSAAALLKWCESTEESVEIAYTNASDQNPTRQTHALIEKHRKEILEIRTRLVRLVDELKDGVDFQKNE